METYPFKLAVGTSALTIPARGDLFVYESVTSTGAAAVRVKPDNGGEIILRPGQRFRTPTTTERWNIRMDGTDPVDGFFNIGEGDFDDANTKNVFKLDATFANTVTVTNDAAHAVPVAINGLTPVAGAMPVTLMNAQIEIVNDVGNRIPVSLDPSQSFGVSAPVMAYTNYVALNIAAASGGTLIAAGANTNGVIVEQVLLEAGSGNLLAKATVPTSATDGDFWAG